MTTHARSAAIGLTIALLFPAGAVAQEKYIGEIFMGGWNFCPRGSLPAHGQLVAINDNQALFSLLGTQFGGDGRTTFGVPDLRGRAPIGAGQGPGLSNYRIGQAVGAESVALSTGQMPSHTHSATGTLRVTTQGGNTSSPAGNVPGDDGNDNIYRDAAPDAAGRADGVAVTVAAAGGGQPVDIRQPTLGITFCVVTQGIFPSH